MGCTPPGEGQIRGAAAYGRPPPALKWLLLLLRVGATPSRSTAGPCAAAGGVDTPRAGKWSNCYIFDDNALVEGTCCRGGSTPPPTAQLLLRSGREDPSPFQMNCCCRGLPPPGANRTAAAATGRGNPMCLFLKFSQHGSRISQYFKMRLSVCQCVEWPQPVLRAGFSLCHRRDPVTALCRGFRQRSAGDFEFSVSYYVPAAVCAMCGP